MKADRIVSFFAQFGQKKTPAATGVVSTTEKEIPQMLQETPALSKSEQAQPVSNKRPLHFREGRTIITADTAQRMLEEISYPRQRSYRIEHIDALADQIKRQMLSDVTQIHLCRKPDGSLVVVNGHHRLNAVVASGISCGFQIAITDVENDEEVDRHYASHDTLARNRSTTDVLRATRLAEKSELPQTFLARGKSAVLVILSGGIREPWRLNKPDAKWQAPNRWLEGIRPWMPNMRAFHACLEGAGGFSYNLLNRKVVFSVALVTLKYQAEKAREFWSGIALDDGLKRSDPRKTLLNWLSEHPMASNMSEPHLRACAVAWNAWYEGRSLTVIKANGDGPVIILGTPYSGRKAKAHVD